MRSALLSAVAAWMTATAAFVQPSPRLHDLLTTDRLLTRGETAEVLAAAARTLAGTAFRWSTDYDDSRGQPGSIEVVAGPNGRPRFVRMNVSYDPTLTIAHPPGTNAPDCVR